MEGNIKESKKIIFQDNYSKIKENLFLFEISEEFLAQLKKERSFRMKSIRSQF